MHECVSTCVTRFERVWKHLPKSVCMGALVWVKWKTGLIKDAFVSAYVPVNIKTLLRKYLN